MNVGLKRFAAHRWMLALVALGAGCGEAEVMPVGPDGATDALMDGTDAPTHTEDVPPADVVNDVPIDDPPAVDVVDVPDEPDVPSCPPRTERCGDRCVDTTTDAEHCGRCGVSCRDLPGVDRGAIRCVAGACRLDEAGACEPGRAHCSTNPADGCEAEVTSATRCGACANACAEPTPMCTGERAGDAGTPSFACRSGCAGMTPLRCEMRCVDPMTSVAHCGGCGRACPAIANGAATCLDGACGFACNPGFHRCGGACMPNDATGSCGTSCTPCPSPPPNAAATCDGTSCGFACNSGFHRCGDRCLSDASPLSCGMSCQACEAPEHAAATCDGRSCGFVCEAGYHLCGGRCAPDASVNSCGSSCAPCPSAPTNGVATCDGRSCGVRCDAGYTPCGGRCVDLSRDTANCGGCSVACAAPQAISACQSGQCAIQACLAGYADCNGSAADGCEASLANATNCGRCGVVCVGACDGGACTERLLDDGLEGGAGEWVLGSRWFLGTAAYGGRYVLHAQALRYGPDCSVSSMAHSRRAFDLSRARVVTLEFESAASYCAYDTVEVVASTDGGRTWESVDWIGASSWTRRSVNLSRYAGRSSVHVGFRIENICEDVCGTEWRVDDVRLTAR